MKKYAEYTIQWSDYYKKFMVFLVKYDPMESILVSRHNSYLDAAIWTKTNPI